jgi:hypothetical protein
MELLAEVGSTLVGFGLGLVAARLLLSGVLAVAFGRRHS